jgi:hypothetical protein
MKRLEWNAVHLPADGAEISEAYNVLSVFPVRLHKEGLRVASM